MGVPAPAADVFRGCHCGRFLGVFTADVFRDLPAVNCTGAGPFAVNPGIKQLPVAEIFPNLPAVLKMVTATQRSPWGSQRPLRTFFGGVTADVFRPQCPLNFNLIRIVRRASTERHVHHLMTNCHQMVHNVMHYNTLCAHQSRHQSVHPPLVAIKLPIKLPSN